MARTTPWTATNGFWLGILAGAVFLAAEMIVAAASGDFFLAPFRMFASIFLGQAAFTGPLGVALVLGGLFHFAFSAVLGFFYTFIDAAMSPESRMNWGMQAAVGALFGLLVWAVDFQLIARFLYPWFLGTPQFLQAVLHALCFGLPLGLAFALIERRHTAHHAALSREERTSS